MKLPGIARHPEPPAELTDREVNERFARVLGRTLPTRDEMVAEARRVWAEQPDCQWFSSLGGFSAYRDGGSVIVSAYTLPCATDERDFAQFVIPALDARGLGEKYVETLASMLPNFGPAWFNSEVWRIASAPLSLRARAALTVLENGND